MLTIPAAMSSRKGRHMLTREGNTRTGCDVRGDHAWRLVNVVAVILVEAQSGPGVVAQ